MHEVEPGIFYTDSYAGTTLGAIALSRGIIFIDAPLHPETGYAWKSVFLKDKEKDFHKIIINLDAHPDRTIGSKVFKCPIYAHQKAAAKIEGRPAIFRGEIPKSGAEWENHPETKGLRWAVPTVSFTEKIKFHWGGPTTILEHHPGPRPGASWVLVPERKVVFVGDAVLNNSPPLLDHADIPQWLKTLATLQSADFENFTIISGRCGIVSLTAVKKQYENLAYLLERTEKLANKNAPPEAVSDLSVAILDKFTTDSKRHDFYLQRLRYGLYQYYMKHYVSES